MKSEIRVLTSHHRDCAALWPAKACDCGYAEQRVLPRLGPIPAEAEQRKAQAKRRLSRTGLPVGKYPSARVLAKTDTTVMRECTACLSPFNEPRRHGRPFSKCPSCR